MSTEVPHSPTTESAEDEVPIREAKVFVYPDFTNGDPTLSDAEIEFFKENGFLVKRGLLNAHDTFKKIIDYAWDSVPRGLLKRDDPTSWLRIPNEEWTEEDAATVGQLTRGGWKFRSRGAIGSEPLFVDGIANHPRMRELVAKFIGEPVRLSRRVRGVYIQFPQDPDVEGQLGPHADGTTGHLTAMVLIDDIAPHCGGFTVWPGSHRCLHPYFATVFGNRRDPEMEEALAEARDDAIRNTTPVEFPGRAGDVVFWHQRLIHSPGVNRSAELGEPAMRYVVPCAITRRTVCRSTNRNGGPAGSSSGGSTRETSTKTFRRHLPTYGTPGPFK